MCKSSVVKFWKSLCEKAFVCKLLIKAWRADAGRGSKIALTKKYKEEATTAFQRQCRHYLVFLSCTSHLQAILLMGKSSVLKFWKTFVCKLLIKAWRADAGRGNCLNKKHKEEATTAFQRQCRYFLVFFVVHQPFAGNLLMGKSSVVKFRKNVCVQTVD